ncbi:hypothetical protein BC831DRAFT_122354 [Entophlyctis helioformis]|nr:hypothetical protein BC831DRAFT_122354 [Entophlyctis helioformis]
MNQTLSAQSYKAGLSRKVVRRALLDKASCKLVWSSHEHSLIDLCFPAQLGPLAVDEFAPKSLLPAMVAAHAAESAQQQQQRYALQPSKPCREATVLSKPSATVTASAINQDLPCIAWTTVDNSPSALPGAMPVNHASLVCNGSIDPHSRPLLSPETVPSTQRPRLNNPSLALAQEGEELAHAIRQLASILGDLVGSSPTRSQMFSSALVWGSDAAARHFVIDNACVQVNVQHLHSVPSLAALSMSAVADLIAEKAAQISPDACYVCVDIPAHDMALAAQEVLAIEAALAKSVFASSPTARDRGMVMQGIPGSSAISADPTASLAVGTASLNMSTIAVAALLRETLDTEGDMGSIAKCKQWAQTQSYGPARSAIACQELFMPGLCQDARNKPCFAYLASRLGADTFLPHMSVIGSCQPSAFISPSASARVSAFTKSTRQISAYMDAVLAHGAVQVFQTWTISSVLQACNGRIDLAVLALPALVDCVARSSSCVIVDLDSILGCDTHCTKRKMLAQLLIEHLVDAMCSTPFSSIVLAIAQTLPSQALLLL